MTDAPIEGQALLVAAAKASVAGRRLPALVERAQRDLDARAETLARQYECVHGTGGTRVLLADEGFWAAVGERLGFDRREADAVRRAHAEQLRRTGRRADRLEEFDAALEIREPVVVRAASDDT